MTASPSSSSSSRPEFRNNSRSEIDPPYSGEINENAPDGVIPAKTLAVL